MVKERKSRKIFGLQIAQFIYRKQFAEVKSFARFKNWI